MSAAVTPEALARMLPGLSDALEQAEREAPDHDLAANRRWRIVSDRIDRVEDAILALPAVSIADAVAQLVQVHDRLNMGLGFEPDPANPYKHFEPLPEALLSALSVLAKLPGIDLPALGGDFVVSMIDRLSVGDRS